jgi:tetratricopeptide (TPR) repeat protein
MRSAPHRLLPVLGLLAAAAAVPAAASAQELTLRREVPPEAWGGCPPANASTPSDADRQEAERLAGSAAQAAILGDAAAVLDLLGRAAALDPASPGIAYRHGRALEEAGRRDDAILAYCRYLSLAPDSPDAAEARARRDALAYREGAMPADAVRAFRSGIAAWDAGRIAEAETAFGRAAEEAPHWPAPIYNRALVRVAARSPQPALADLRRYLELSPGADDFDAVLDVVTTLRAAAPHNPTAALVAGLLVPGLGQITTDRPAAGLLVLGGAAGALAAGMLITRVEVDCLAPPVDGRCPEGQVLRERTTRPYQELGIAGALAVGAAGAFEAWHGARRTRGPDIGLIRISALGATLAPPAMSAMAQSARLELVRLRF